MCVEQSNNVVCVCVEQGNDVVCVLSKVIMWFVCVCVCVEQGNDVVCMCVCVYVCVCVLKENKVLRVHAYAHVGSQTCIIGPILATFHTEW